MKNTFDVSEGLHYYTSVSYLEELEKGGLGHAGFLDEGHGVGEVVHVVAVHVHDHGLGKLPKQNKNKNIIFSITGTDASLILFEMYYTHKERSRNVVFEVRCISTDFHCNDIGI